MFQFGGLGALFGGAKPPNPVATGLYWWWMSINGARKCRSGDDTNLLLPNFYVFPALSSQRSVFSKLCSMKTLLHFFLLQCQSCCSLRKVFLCGRISGLIKSSYHNWLSMMTSSEGPLFSFASTRPIPKTTTGCSPSIRVICLVAFWGEPFFLIFCHCHHIISRLGQLNNSSFLIQWIRTKWRWF